MKSSAPFVLGDASRIKANGCLFVDGREHVRYRAPVQVVTRCEVDSRRSIELAIAATHRELVGLRVRPSDQFACTEMMLSEPVTHGSNSEELP